MMLAYFRRAPVGVSLVLAGPDWDTAVTTELRVFVYKMPKGGKWRVSIGSDTGSSDHGQFSSYADAVNFAKDIVAVNGYTVYA